MFQRVSPRQGRPPSPPGSPAKLVLRVCVCRPCQDLSSAVRVARQALFASAKAPKRQSPAKLVLRVMESVVRRPVRVVRQGRPPSPSAEWQSAVPAKVVRRPRQGRPPSSFYECLESRRPPSPSGSPAKLFLRVPNPSGSSAVPARVAHQALFASAKAPFRPGWSAVPVRVVRRPRQGRPPSFASAKAPSPPRFTGVWSVSSAVPARVVCARPPSPARVVRRPRQGRFCFCEWQSAVPARVVRRPRQGRPPSSFYECLESVFVHPPGSPAKLFLRVPKRRPRQGRPPSPPGSPAKLFLRVPKRRPRQLGRPPSPSASRQGRPPSSFCECQSAVPAWPPSSFYECLESVVRRPRQGRPPSPPGSPAKLFLRVPKRRPLQGRPPSPPGSPAKPNQRVCPRQGRPPAPPGSPAKLFEGRPGPARVLALGDKGTQFYYCAPWLAVPNQVWQTRSAWQSKQISKR